MIFPQSDHPLAWLYLRNFKITMVFSLKCGMPVQARHKILNIAQGT